MKTFNTMRATNIRTSLEDYNRNEPVSVREQNNPGIEIQYHTFGSEMKKDGGDPVEISNNVAENGRPKLHQLDSEDNIISDGLLF